MGDGEGNFKTLDYRESGFFIKGQIRDIKEISINKKKYILVALNNDEMKIFSRNEDKVDKMAVVKK